MFDHEARDQSAPGKTAVRKIVLHHGLLAAVLAGLTTLPATASGPQSAEDNAEVRPAERIEPAPVVPATELESAAVPQTALEEAAVVPQTELEAATVQATEIEDAPVVAPTELEDAPVVPLTEVEEIVVTGSRLARTPGELAGNLVVLDEDFINATGEVTLERVLRQLPQNLNSTTEQFGSEFKDVDNFTGLSTVNLRGLGAESTLILIDGKRVGHNGFLGGVTDVSSIPLSIVERIEVMLDGASAIYGSDAVGGVVNIITRKDYQGVEIDLNYNTPSGREYNEWRGTISAGGNFDGSRVRGTYSRSVHSGLDGADREATLFQRSIFAGPQYDIRFCCLPGQIHVPILYRLGGDVLTQAEYNALSPEDQARASAETHAVLPPGFNAGSSVDSITQFGPPNWGSATQAGWDVLPESVRNSFSGSLDRDLNERMSAEVHARYERRDTTYRRGYVGFSGQTLGGGNPFNPFGRSVHLRGQRPDMGAVSTETIADIFDVGIDFEGGLGDNWDWEVGLGFSSEDSRSQRLNTTDSQTLGGGLTSDGVTPRSQFLGGHDAASCAELGGTFFFGLCRITLPPLDPINPFGDLSPYLNDALLADSLNEQKRVDALLRGGLGALPAGEVRLLVGYSWHETVLNSASEFQVGTTSAPIGDIDTFETDAQRANQAVFGEALVPIFGALNLALSARWDSYDTPDVLYRDSEEGPETAEDIRDPGTKTTWGAGLVFTPVDDITFRVNAQTAFVAPQLNQILRRTSETMASGFRGLLIQNPDGSLGFADALITEGGNSELGPETADTLSAGVEFNPRFLPGLGLKATWNETQYEDRISLLSAFIIDPDNPPSHTRYIASEDIWFQERRWINVSSVDREGMDYEAYYRTSTDLGDFAAQFRHSRTDNYQFTLDPATDDPISVVGHTEGNTAIGVVSKTASTAQFSWGYRGMEAAVDVSSRSATTTELGGVTTTYEPATIVDLSLSYNFAEARWLPAPAWANTTRVRLTINNLRDSYDTTSSVNDDGETLNANNDTRSLLYGRIFNLSLHMSM